MPESSLQTARENLVKLAVGLKVITTPGGDDLSVTFDGPTAANAAIRLVAALTKQGLVDYENERQRGDSLPALPPGSSGKVGKNVTLRREFDGKFTLKLEPTAPLDVVAQKLETAANTIAGASQAK